MTSCLNISHPHHPTPSLTTPPCISPSRMHPKKEALPKERRCMANMDTRAGRDGPSAGEHLACADLACLRRLVPWRSGWLTVSAPSRAPRVPAHPFVVPMLEEPTRRWFFRGAGRRGRGGRAKVDGPEMGGGKKIRNDQTRPQVSLQYQNHKRHMHAQKYYALATAPDKQHTPFSHIQHRYKPGS